MGAKEQNFLADAFEKPDEILAQIGSPDLKNV